MKIQKYEDWMRPQVVALFDLEYNTGEEKFDQLFRSFYEHAFQIDKCIRIVALEGERVAGFQSFFYWPVVKEGRTLKSYQSGNSLVHPDFRGKGLFAKMLNYIHEPESGFHCDLLIGFPVEASYNSFIRNKWQNPFNLQWHILLMNPLLSLFSKPDKQLRRALGERVKSGFNAHESITYVAQSASFDDYRFAYEKGDFFRYTFQKGNQKAIFEMKSQRRKKVISELVIGKFLSTENDTAFILEAFESLIRVVRKSSSFTMLSIAVNPQVKILQDVLQQCRFKKISRSIYFIAKGPFAEAEKDWSGWWIYRSDIDTW